MNKLLIIIFIFCAGWAGAQHRTGDLLIKNGHILTVTKGDLEDTDILIRDGKISRIGKNISAPAGIRVVDAKGLFVMPGIIDAHSHIALDAINEATSPITSEVFTGNAINPFDLSIYRALAGGVTISHAMHGSANAIGGECETIKHRYGTFNPEILKMEGAPRTIKFALGENPTRVHGEGNKIVPKTRMGVEAVFRRAFSEAQEYKAAWDAYNLSKKNKRFRGKAPEYSRRLETIAGILTGEVIIHCHSYRADEILMLMEVCKDYGIKNIVFQHVNEGFKVAPELAAFGASASIFSDWWAYKFEVYYSTAYNAAILTKNGVNTSINSDSWELIRHLYHEAGKSQKYGQLNDDEALALITINPAKQLGIDSRTGSIEAGKDADIVIFKDHPLSIYAVPQMTIIDGVVYFDINDDHDDQRIYVDPSEVVDVTIHGTGTHHENCMIDAEEFLLNVRISGMK